METEVDTANCPHCQATVQADGINYMVTEGNERVLVCPECEAMLGSAMTDRTFAELAAIQFAEDFEEADTFAEAIEAMLAGHPPTEQREILEQIRDRMGQ